MNFSQIGTIAAIFIIEAGMSFDNVAVLTDKAKKAGDEKVVALIGGYLLAFFLRMLMIFAGLWFISFRWIAPIGGAYLIGKTLEHFGGSDSEKSEHEVTPLYKVLFELMFLDAIFAIDSVTGVLALSNVNYIVITGVTLGMITMCLFGVMLIKFEDAENFSLFGREIPHEDRELFIVRLTHAAYILILFVGTVLFAKGLHLFELGEVMETFLVVSLLVFGIALQYSDNIRPELSKIAEAVQPACSVAATPINNISVVAFFVIAAVAGGTVAASQAGVSLHEVTSQWPAVQTTIDLLSERIG